MLILQEVREEKSILQKDLASKLNRTRACISSWETSKTEPDLVSLVKMADILEVSTDYLLGRSNDIGIVQSNANLTEIEDKLLTTIRKLSVKDQWRALGIIQALAS